MNERTYSDVYKNGTDFIEYMQPDLTWYAFNFIMIMLPLFLVFLTHVKEVAKA